MDSKYSSDVVDAVFAAIESGKISIGKTEFFELMEIGCDFERWKETARELRKKLADAKENDILLGILEDLWQDTNYHEADREDYYNFGDSPLEVLAHGMGDHLSYPPPEILQIISRQFAHYMAMGGKITMEEAFFGSPKGKGTYAKRRAAENQDYEKFHLIWTRNQHGYSSQLDVLEALTKEEFLAYSGGFAKEPNRFYKYWEKHDLDSFLRGYRRWKKKTQD